MAVDGSSSSVAEARITLSPDEAVRANLLLQFLKLVLLILITPSKDELIGKIPDLPHPAPQMIADLIKEIAPAKTWSDEGSFHRASDVESDHDESRDSMSSFQARNMDRELVLEEHIANLRSQLNRYSSEVRDLKAEKEEISNAYTRLQESYDAVKQQLAETEEQLKKFALIHNEKEQRSLKDLEAKISQQEEVIGCQETQLNEYQSKEAEVQRRFHKLAAADERLQRLQDDYDVQKVELDHQTKKANAGEKYKQKVQASQNVERERDSFRKELDEARSKLQVTESFRRDNAKLQQENREISQTLSRSERDNSDLRETKKSFLAEIDRLHRDSKALREAVAQYQERISDLEERSGGSDIHSCPTVVDGGLESELADASKNEQQMQVARIVLLWSRVLMDFRKSRILDLEKQSRQLSIDATDKDANIDGLRRELEKAHELSADQYKQVQQLRQDVSVLQSSLTEIRQGHPIEGSVSSSHTIVKHPAHDCKSTETFLRMREQLQLAYKKRVELEEKLSSALKDVEAATNDRTSTFETHCMMSDLNIDLLGGDLLDKPKLQMVEEVKRQHAIALIQLQSEHDALQKRHNRLQEDFDQQADERNQAWRESHEAFIATTQERTKTTATTQNLQEIRDIMMRASTAKSPNSIEYSSELWHRNIEALANTIEESHERMAKAQEVDLQISSSDIAFETLSLPQQSTPPRTPSVSPLKRISRKFFSPADANKI